ncbi:MAG: hypothetical protein SEPTF4163_002292 [Sporothrix epigloea]
MASSTSPTFAAQIVPDELHDGQPARPGCDSAAKIMAPDTELNTTLPDNRDSTQHTSPEPLRVLQKNDDDNDGSHAPAAPNREPDGRADENDKDPESSGHDPIGTNLPLVVADSNPLRPQPPYLADTHPTEASVEILREPTPEMQAQDPPALPATTADAAQLDAAAATPDPTQDGSANSASATSLPLPPFASPPVPPPYWTHSRDGSNERNGFNDNASFDTTRPAMAVPYTKKPAGAASMFSSSFSRRLDGSSRGQAPTSSSASPYSPSTAQRPAASTKQPSSITGGSGSRNHRREASSSTLDFSANIITLQDNEALDEEEGGESSSGGWNYQPNQTSAFSANGSASSAYPPAAGWPSPEPSTSNTSGHLGRGGLAVPPTAPASTTRTASNSSKANRCWARRIDITDHTIIGAGGSGSKAALPKMGAFVVWTIRVQTLDDTVGGSGRPPPSSQSPAVAGHSFSVYKRYSEFDTLRQRLVASFPQARGGGALPPLPPKTVLGNFRPEFLEKRRTGLQYFLNCILLNPEFAGSPILQDFLFS